MYRSYLNSPIKFSKFKTKIAKKNLYRFGTKKHAKIYTKIFQKYLMKIAIIGSGFFGSVQ